MSSRHALCLLVLCTSFAGCTRSLDERKVRDFVDRADATARTLYAPHICELRGENFRLHLRFQGYLERLPPSDLEIGRKTFCLEAAKNAWLRQYKLERKSLDIELAADRRTARVTAEYEETLPYFEPDMRPASPFDFQKFQVLTTRDDSVVGIEGGDLVFLRTDADVVQKLVPKQQLDVPVVN
ncbi:MAG TPA: hypothetical protein VMF52_18290 [Steroidobacteraceae bacterium]|nr:hypothetical protein [Steroidobacteraceae bacterium]